MVRALRLPAPETLLEAATLRAPGLPVESVSLLVPELEQPPEQALALLAPDLSLSAKAPEQGSLPREVLSPV